MKKLFPVIMLLQCIALFVSGQDRHLIDTLESQLKILNKDQQEVRRMDDSLTAKLLHALSIAYWYHDIEKAMEYSQQMLTVSVQIGYTKGMASAYNNIGSLQAMSGDYVQAFDNFSKAIRLRTEIGDRKELATSYSNMGNLFNYQGNFPEALKNYYSALKLSEEIDDKLNLSRCLTNMASIYGQQANSPEINMGERDRLFDQALKNNYTALEIRKAINDKVGISINYNSIGSINRLRGNYSEALENYREALKIAENIGDKRGIALVNGNIGSTYAYQDNFNEAMKHQLLSLKLYDEIGDKKGVAGRYSEIGGIFLRQKRTENAFKNFNLAIEQAKPISDLETTRNSYQGLVQIDSARGDFKGAFENFKMYLTFRDSLINGEKSRVITQQQMQFEFEKKQIGDSLNFLNDQQVAEVKLQKQKAYTISGLIGTIITIILLFFVYSNYKKQRIANRKLKEAQEELIRNEKLAAFGVMATRLSHEIQNPLNFVNNFSELSREMLEELLPETDLSGRNTLELVITNLDKVHEHGERVARIVGELQEYGKKGTVHDFFEIK